MSLEDQFIKIAAEKMLKEEGLTRGTKSKVSDGPEGVTVETDTASKKLVQQAQTDLGDGVLNTD